MEPPFKLKVRLETRDGELVREAEIPAFKALPEVITMEGRTFTSTLHDVKLWNSAVLGLVPAYREVYAYALPV